MAWRVFDWCVAAALVSGGLFALAEAVEGMWWYWLECHRPWDWFWREWVGIIALMLVVGWGMLFMGALAGLRGFGP